MKFLVCPIIKILKNTPLILETEILIENWATFSKFVCEQNYSAVILLIEPIYDYFAFMTSRLLDLSHSCFLAFSQALRPACRCAVRSALRMQPCNAFRYSPMCCCWACSASRIGTCCIRFCCRWKFVDLMNGGRKVLIYRVMFSQHLLNKSLTKREINERGSPVSQRSFWLVEILLRV